MKGNLNAKKNLVRRNRSINSGIRNYYTGSRRLRGIAVGNSQIERSSADALGDNSFSSKFAHRLGIDGGSVTAEFAVVVPAVILILIVAIQVLSFQSARMGLIELAAESARAIARGEDSTVIESLVKDAVVNPKPTWVIQHKDFELCVEFTQSRSIAGLGLINLVEAQCARKSGL